MTAPTGPSGPTKPTGNAPPHQVQRGDVLTAIGRVLHNYPLRAIDRAALESLHDKVAAMPKGTDFFHAPDKTHHGKNPHGGQPGTGDPPPPPPPPDTTPASIAVTPVIATLVAGATQQLVAAVKNAGGSVIPGVGVDGWSADDPSVAAVDGAGLVTAAAPGSASVTAVKGAITSNPAALTVTAVPNILLQFPEIPGGASVLTSQPMRSLTPAVGHDWVGGPDGVYGTFETSGDDGPVSPPNFYRLRTPAGQAGGGVGIATAQSNRYYLAPDGVEGHSTIHEGYYSIVFKVKPPYAAPESLGQKLFYVQELCFFTFAGAFWLEWRSLETDFTKATIMISNECDVHDTINFHPNVVQTIMEVDRWYRATLYFKSSSNSEVADGVAKVWINGTLNINKSGIFTRGADRSNHSEMNADLEWGGGGVTPFELDRRIDHLLIALP